MNGRHVLTGEHCVYSYQWQARVDRRTLCLYSYQKQYNTLTLYNTPQQAEQYGSSCIPGQQIRLQEIQRAAIKAQIRSICLQSIQPKQVRVTQLSQW